MALARLASWAGGNMATANEAAFDALGTDIAEILRLSDAGNDVVWVNDRLGHNNSRVLARAGESAGWANARGARVVQIAGLRLFTHRLVWRLHYGEWPIGIVDHIDLDPTNNAISNLRIATESQNRANTKPRAPTGFKGVTAIKNVSGFTAQITIDGKNKYLGRHRTPEQAHAAYCEAARKAFGEFARVE